MIYIYFWGVFWHPQYAIQIYKSGTHFHTTMVLTSSKLCSPCHFIETNISLPFIAIGPNGFFESHSGGYFVSILWHNQIGDHPQEDLSKYIWK